MARPAAHASSATTPRTNGAARATDIIAELVRLNIANRGSDGKCPNPNTFVICRTPETIDREWKAAMKFLDEVDR